MPDADTSPIVFLDIDDVLCLNRPYSGFDVLDAVRGSRADAEAVLGAAFSEGPKAVLQSLHDALPRGATYVISSSWRLHFSRQQLIRIFNAAGLGFVADGMLDESRWCTPDFPRQTRGDEIEDWLARHHRGEPFVIVDDVASGSGLTIEDLHAGHPFTDRIILCELGTGLEKHHATFLRDTLARAASGRLTPLPGFPEDHSS